MNLYFELLRKPVFHVKDVNEYYGNMDSARSAIKRLMKEGMVAKIRNDLYTCISGETMRPVANRFQIASNITPTSYVSHHTAMEYYGLADQIFYTVYVSSKTSFRDFDFDGYTYHYVPSKYEEGVDKPPYSGGVVVTNLERTLVDSIKDMDKISGFEETYQGISAMRKMQEIRVLKYMELLNNQFLYQKAGYLLSDKREQLGLSEDFFEACKDHIGKSKRYLTSDIIKGRYDSEWNLIVPINMDEKNGVIDDAAV